MFTKWTQVKDIINFAYYTFVSKFSDGNADLFGNLTEIVCVGEMQMSGRQVKMFNIYKGGL